MHNDSHVKKCTYLSLGYGVTIAHPQPPPMALTPTCDDQRQRRVISVMPCSYDPHGDKIAMCGHLLVTWAAKLIEVFLTVDPKTDVSHQLFLRGKYAAFATNSRCSGMVASVSGFLSFLKDMRDRGHWKNLLEYEQNN
ncbi:hypothetical protein Pelo_13296 [Pelomyxa schiedti]|nr:hypothetical protein Pelo_13296 [Pelomyxa schiedti]